MNMKQEYLRWIAKKQGYARAMEILALYGQLEDLDEIDEIREIAIKEVMDGRYSNFEKEVMVNEIKKAFLDYKTYIEFKYRDVV